MKILFLVSHFPYPPHSGGALRAFGLLQGLIHAGHNVVLFCLAENSPPNTPLHTLCLDLITVPPPMRSTTDRLLDIILTPYADMARRFWSEAAAQRLREVLAETVFDLVHAESIEMAAYFPVIQQAQPNLPFIYGSLNAEFDLQRTIFKAESRRPRRWVGAAYSWIQWRRLTRLEREICDQAAHVLAVSEADRDLLASLSSTPITVVKNGITVADYLHIQPDLGLGAGAVVFTGSMSYRPNVDAALWFATEIWPRIQHPTKHLYLVGHRPHPRLEALAEAADITVTGRVDEMEPYWRGAAAYIAPLRMGSGTRFKLLEAMAAGCAVVSTTMGAQGLGVVSGQEILLADSAADFATAVQQLLDDAPLREALAQCGRNFVETYFDWSVIVPHLLAAYVAATR